MSHQGLCGMTKPSSAVKAVSGATSQWSATQFSLTIYESTGAVWAQESICHLWISFGGYFWLGCDSVFLDCFWVKRVVCTDESMGHLCKHFRWRFMRGQQLCFSWLFLSQQVLSALRIPCVISGSSFGGYLWVGSDSVFLDCLWVNRGCVRWGFHV
jgi:hypothetical protein